MEPETLSLLVVIIGVELVLGVSILKDWLKKRKKRQRPQILVEVDQSYLKPLPPNNNR